MRSYNKIIIKGKHYTTKELVNKFKVTTYRFNTLKKLTSFVDSTSLKQTIANFKNVHKTFDLNLKNISTKLGFNLTKTKQAIIKYNAAIKLSKSTVNSHKPLTVTRLSVENKYQEKYLNRLKNPAKYVKGVERAHVYHMRATFRKIDIYNQLNETYLHAINQDVAVMIEEATDIYQLDEWYEIPKQDLAAYMDIVKGVIESAYPDLNLEEMLPTDFPEV